MTSGAESRFCGVYNAEIIAETIDLLDTLGMKNRSYLLTRLLFARGVILQREGKENQRKRKNVVGDRERSSPNDGPRD